MLKPLLGSNSSEKLNTDCWAFLKFWFKCDLGSSKVISYSPSCRFWFLEYLITRSPFQIWDYTNDFYVHFMPANTENLWKAGNKLAKKPLFCLSIIPRKLSFPVLYYLQSNHRSKTSPFLTKRYFLTTIQNYINSKLSLILTNLAFSSSTRCLALVSLPFY